MRLLLDGHLSHTIARQLRDNGVDVVSLSEWQRGHYRTASDDQILAAALEDNRVLATRDVRTIPDLLKGWAETGQPHAGVILINRKTLHPNDIGGCSARCVN